jgi:hypothetical protein
VFEQETENIIKLIGQYFPTESYNSVGVKQILAADIPNPVKVFLRADVQDRLNKELSQLHSGSRFNFNNPEVQNYQQQINSILVLNYSFEQLEFKKRIDDIVHIIINYLIRPQWTLYSFIFEKEKTIRSKMLVDFLSYFGPYEYLRTITTHYFSDKQVESITDEEFKTILWKIDGEYLKRKSGEELANMMMSIFDFFDFQNSSGSYSLPVKAIIKYFEDKGLATAIPRFEGEIAQGKTVINRRELRDILKDIHLTIGIFQVEKLEIDHKALIEINTSIENQLKNDYSHSNIIHDLASAISDSDKRKFIKKIFKQSEEEFGNSLKSIGRQVNWKQASKIIDEIFITNNVDPYSSEATRFLEVMFGQFHSTK